MLINQNHEMSIKLKKKNEIISHLRNIISHGVETKKDVHRSNSHFQNEDNSFDSNFR